ncbi:MAG TPA: peptidylprolyl isomerase [Crocinitomix sp.]|nr:peptidylprolyl isomerase [Crocinitomix sp.]
MKKPLQYIKALILTLIILTSSFVGKTQVIDKIVAQVGDEIILLSDIQSQKIQMISEGINVSNTTDCQILEEMLYQKLLVNQAQIDSIEVSDDMVNAEMEQRIKYFEEQIGGRDKLEEYYGKSVAQIKAEFFNIIKKRILAERMEEKITENLTVTNSDVEAFYKSLPKDSIPYINSKISIAHIVKYPKITEADNLKAKERLTMYREQIVSGNKRFQTIAVSYSDDPGSSIKGGDLGWQSKGTMVPEFEAELFLLEPGEISPVFKTQFGYHIIQMIERRGNNYHVRHILISPKASYKAFDEAVVEIEKIYQQILKGELTFEQAAMKFSDDENSKISGGKIINPYTGDYFWDLQNINSIDPQIYRLIDGLKVGKMSQPARYQNMYEQKEGVRFVKLLAKTKPHLANLTDDYQLIKSACTEQKKQEIVNAWIENQIKSTYIRLDKNYYSCNFNFKWIKEN